MFWMWFVAIYLEANLAVCWTTELVYGMYVLRHSQLHLFQAGKMAG
jgi:hypothetical protein